MTWYAFLTSSHHSLDPGKWEPKFPSPKQEVKFTHHVVAICLLLLNVWSPLHKQHLETYEPPKTILWHFLFIAFKMSCMAPLRTGCCREALWQPHLAAPLSDVHMSCVYPVSCPLLSSELQPGSELSDVLSENPWVAILENGEPCKTTMLWHV